MIQGKGVKKMNDDGGAIILCILGLVTSLPFITLYIIEPLMKNKNRKKIKYHKIKFFFTVLYFMYFFVLLIFDLLGFIKCSSSK